MYDMFEINYKTSDTIENKTQVYMQTELLYIIR